MVQCPVPSQLSFTKPGTRRIGPVKLPAVCSNALVICARFAAESEKNVVLDQPRLVEDGDDG